MMNNDGVYIRQFPTEEQQEPYHHTRAVCDEAAASAEGATSRATVNGRPGVGGQRLGVHQ